MAERGKNRRPNGPARRRKTGAAPQRRRQGSLVKRLGNSLRRGRLRTALLISFGIVLGIAISALSGFRWFRDRAAPSPRAFVSVSWPANLSATEAATLLSDLALTDSPAAMDLYLRAVDALDCVEPGPHMLPSGATPQELLGFLCRGDVRPEVSVTLPEGYHRYAIATRLEKAGVVSRAAFLQASADTERLFGLAVEPGAHPEADTAEGYLFPATYRFRQDSRPWHVVKRLVDEGARRWRRLATRHKEGYDDLQRTLKFGRREVLILASMVEKEAAVAEERALIASVFLNRLQDRAYPYLQSDPTASYGCYVMPDRIGACRGFDGKATPAILRDRNNVFSTYITRGLPPGPIANPGEAAIEAVLEPADTDYLFFVAKGGGRHTFSETYEQHVEAVAQLKKMRGSAKAPEDAASP